MLIARHGKLVLEEYFHGYHRNLPHDTSLGKQEPYRDPRGCRGGKRRRADRCLDAGLQDDLSVPRTDTESRSAQDPYDGRAPPYHFVRATTVTIVTSRRHREPRTECRSNKRISIGTTTR